MRAIIEIAAQIDSFDQATVRVTVERVRYADRRSEIIARASIPGLVHTSGETTFVPVELALESLTDWSYLVVRAHVDLDGDGEVSVGDLLTQRAYAVNADSQVVTMIVEPVGA